MSFLETWVIHVGSSLLHSRLDSAISVSGKVASRLASLCHVYKRHYMYVQVASREVIYVVSAERRE